MPFNSVGAYTANHKTWDHLGNVFPNVEYSEGTRPHGEWRPAEWLPVTFFDKYYEDFYVITPGKILACDNEGDLVPCQYAEGSAIITYTADDVSEGTIDATTGLAVTVAKTVAVSGVIDFLGVSGVALAVSKPIGVAPYAFLKWAGGDGFNPTAYNQHNYNRQHAVAILCDYVLTMPLVPGSTASEVPSFGVPGSENLSQATLANTPVAKNTVRTPMTFTGTDLDLFVNEQETVDLVTEAGDFHIDLDSGLLTVFKSTAGAASVTVAYSHYASVPTTVSVFASAVGNLQCGDFVKCDSNSNYTLADASDDFKDIIGQVIDVQVHPRSSLEKVRTAFTPAISTDASGSLPGFTGQTDQLPGSATGGQPDAVHFAGAADRVVIINLISR